MTEVVGISGSTVSEHETLITGVLPRRQYSSVVSAEQWRTLTVQHQRCKNFYQSISAGFVESSLHITCVSALTQLPQSFWTQTFLSNKSTEHPLSQIQALKMHFSKIIAATIAIAAAKWELSSPNAPRIPVPSTYLLASAKPQAAPTPCTTTIDHFVTLDDSPTTTIYLATYTATSRVNCHGCSLTVESLGGPGPVRRTGIHTQHMCKERIEYLFHPQIRIITATVTDEATTTTTTVCSPSPTPL